MKQGFGTSFRGLTPVKVFAEHELTKPKNGSASLRLRLFLGWLSLVLFLCGSCFASSVEPGSFPAQRSLIIPQMRHVPSLADFEGMHPNERVRSEMVKADGFLQRDPIDGATASQRTETYLGYDRKNLYVVFLAFDSEPDKVRARMSRREDIWGDDTVAIWLDTFQDHRRAYEFATNALGVQWDGTYTEGSGGDDSFDAVWSSQGKLTDQGYMVLMSIPFRSLRFGPTERQQWGLILERNVVRDGETSYLPYISARTSLYLPQEALLEGLRGISPGRNMQFNPYVSFHSSRSMDMRDTDTYKYSFEKETAGDAGIDAKFVLKDSLVLDATVNPDFSQVESDNPQVAVNNRFELWYPEHRQFFLENSSFFDTPISLVFTRRIADPDYGIRLSGKAGPYSLGFLFADDASPGKSVVPTDPEAGTKAYFGIMRVSRDIGSGSNVGLIYTDREYLDQYNRVGGIDTRLKFGPNWSAIAQAVGSATFDEDDGKENGPAYVVEVDRSGRKLSMATGYRYTSDGFVSEPGFVTRNDIGRFSQWVSYHFRPEGKHLVQWGPSMNYTRAWDHTGLGLEETYSANMGASFRGQTWVNTYYNRSDETLRPVDYDTLAENRGYEHSSMGFSGNLGLMEKASLYASYGWDTRINYVPPSGEAPTLANGNGAGVSLTVRPVTELKIDNGYTFSRMRAPDTNASLFDSHIVRSKWNYQFNRELSLRVIAEYNTVLANPYLTSLQPTKAMNFDVLMTYLLHPGTAVYVGYNSDLQNIDPTLGADPDGNLLRTRSNFINDGRQFFVKLSYLLRF